MTHATQALAGDDFGLAATFIDGGFTSDGILTPAAEQVAGIASHTHAAGGLFVADEVQAGHGRTGEHLWSFQSFGITPDFVTLGKPMGNGYPVAAVVTRSDLVDRFAEQTEFFSTFGGNPVAACAALAVLDVIADARLIERAGRVGAALRAMLEELWQRHPAVRGVRGHGLLVGVELADGDVARRVVDELRERDILIGRTGPGGNVLKIRPPLVFEEAHAALLAERLDEVLAAVQ
jgi:4-aminobutyrate aminotransferase-like enzyme